jgi:hypothetical protein
MRADFVTGMRVLRIYLGWSCLKTTRSHSFDSLIYTQGPHALDMTVTS